MIKIKILVFGLLVGVLNPATSSQSVHVPVSLIGSFPQGDITSLSSFFERETPMSHDVAKPRVSSDYRIIKTNAFKYMNTSVDPCEDFFEYTCGNFKNVYPLQENALTIDHFTLLEEKLTTLLNATLSVDEHPGDPEALRKAKSAYKACIDLDFLNSIKIPERTIIEEEHGFPMVQPEYLHGFTHFGWEQIGEAVTRYGVPMIFSISSYPHPKDATKNVIFINKDDLSNPSMIRPYEDRTNDDIIRQGFLEMAERSPKLKSSSEPAPFDVFLEKMAFKLSRTERMPPRPEDVQENIAKMVDFMRAVYRGGIIPANQTIEKLGDYSATLRTLNNWTIHHFGDTAKLDWVKYMEKVFEKSGVHITEDTEFLTPLGIERVIYGLVNLVLQTPADVVKNFVMMRVFLFMAIDSDDESREALIEYYNKLNNTVPPRWKYCTRKIIDAEGSTGLSFAVAYEYQLRHYNVNGFSTVVDMLQDLQSSFSEIISESSWMNDTIKEIALQKLKNMQSIMAFPDFITYRDKLDMFYDNLRICKWDNYGNSKRIRAFKQAYQLSQLQKRDRTFWDKSPFETNAYYNRPNNRIILPVAMLNPEFFNTNNGILDYGRLGAIIGHEITHGFDTAGQKYDQDGAMTNWGDSTMFANYTRCFIEQYNNYYVEEIDAYVNGTITLNENLADNGGTREAYKAMKKLSSRTENRDDNSTYTEDQLFFIGFGGMWCNNPSLKYRQLMQKNAHSPSKWRVNGVVSNMPEFAEAFSCPSGSNMNPIDKCKLW